MPSGYLKVLHDGGGQVSFTEFVLTCAKQFGVVMSQWDTPDELDRRWHPSDSHQQHIDAAEIQLGLLQLLPVEECQWRAEIEWLRQVAEDAADRLRKAETQTRYLSMLKQVHEWQPAAECGPLKQWMADHLREAVDVDCRHVPSAAGSALAADVWRDARIRQLESVVRFHLERLEAELVECARKRGLAAALQASLPVGSTTLEQVNSD